jgi:ABC-type uncharacterized transport system permease subunit
MTPALRKPTNAALLRHRRRPKYLALAALAIQQRFAYRSNVALDLFAFVSYFPALILLGKLHSNLWIAYVAPVIGLLAVCVAALLWRRGLVQYQSAGN